MVKVTREQMNAVRRQMGKINMSLNILIGYARVGEFSGESSPINHMSVEQIVLAWHGYVKVEPDYVSFDEAFKANSEGKRVLFHDCGSKFDLYPDAPIEKTWMGGYSLYTLYEGKWTIEGDNQ